MNSLWSESVTAPRFEELKENIKTDVLIIGGGICGILCAYMLKNAGVDCVLVEAGRICNGITKNTTAKITVQHGLIYDTIIKRFGKESAQLYFDVQNKALSKYRLLAQDIECDFERKDSFVYSLNDREKIEREVKALQSIGAEAEFAKKLPLPFLVAGAVRVKEQAQFNPLKFLYEISKNLNIYENTKVTEFINGCAVTANGKIKAEKIIVATHFPFINKYGLYFLKMYQHRSYVIALEGANKVDGMFVDESKTGLSFRDANGLLLLGGGGHRTGKNGGNWEELRKFAKHYYKNAKEKYCFATQDCMTLDDIAYIGQYSPHTPNLYVATGFNKWGMTSSMVVATLLVDLILGKENIYAPAFSPSRSILRPQLAINAAESIVGLLTPSAPRCPHLGCALKYNPQEHSWDCSCHGSRFTKDGQLIDNPATADKIIVEKNTRQ